VKRSQRGFTLAEILTVVVIMGLMLSVVAFSAPLFLNGPQEAQSQVDNVESAALALYKMQHDTRPSNIHNVWACSTVLPVCTQPTPGPAMPTAQAVAILTANATGQFVLNGNGTPNWQGYDVYWIVPNADGTSNELRRAFVGVAFGINAPQPGDAVTAVATALGLTTYTTVAQDVWDMKFAIDPTTNTVDLQLDSGDNKGNMSSLRLAGNSYVRN
jgi:prepilin-type N-terminal cleavage/methylation domain-containing protein